MYMKGISILSNEKWDQRYLKLAKEVSFWSKDPSTQIGCIAVNDKGQILATGYNGFPKNIKDSRDRYENKELKYKYIVHGEMNTIYNATHNGVSLDGATMYVTGLPTCSDCAKGIIQVGVKRVVMEKIDIPDHWKDSWNLTKSLFNEAGVQHVFIAKNT